jgi:hypothetical protein
MTPDRMTTRQRGVVLVTKSWPTRKLSSRFNLRLREVTTMHVQPLRSSEAVRDGSGAICVLLLGREVDGGMWSRNEGGPHREADRESGLKKGGSMVKKGRRVGGIKKTYVRC